MPVRATSMLSALAATVALASSTGVGQVREARARGPEGPTPPPSGIAVPPSVLPLLGTHCLDCHDGPRGKGGLDLAPAVRGGMVGEQPLRAVRRRLARRDMPPVDASDAHDARPTRDEYAAAVAAIDAVVAPEVREVPAVRRRNRSQYAGAVRDVLGIGAAGDRAIGGPPVEALLPADEIGEGFDTTGDTLSLPPLLLEKYFDAAEAIAAACVPDPRPRRTVVPPERLERTGQGGVYDGFAMLATNGTLAATADASAGAPHRVTLRIAAQQAGDELARMALEVDGTRVLERSVEADRSKPEEIVWEGELAKGPHRIAVRFLNDFWDPRAADPKRRDRNLALASIELEGPLVAPPPNAFESRAASLAGEGPEPVRLRRVASALGEELFGRALSSEESARLASTARAAAAEAVGRGPAGKDPAGAQASWSSQVRALVAALLVDPRFILRIERDAPGAGAHALTGDEIASRLACFLWSSVPDARLREAARAGDLATADGVAREAARMLEDPRASSLATRFATQWLGIDGLASRTLEPTIYPGIDAALLASMQRETERLFDRVVRGELPVRALLEARATEVDQRLAAHYGFAVAEGAYAADGLASFETPRERPSGVLGHASVLLATSNPTRTSPVKRGKWVLDAILDDPPPPPPPGVPQLPETPEARKGLPMRELMRIHRENPDCASCHVRMDAYGLVFERADADGRMRGMVDGAPVEDSVELAGGQAIEGFAGLEEMLRVHEGFERSLARRLFVYALGRGTADADDMLLDALAARLRARGEFASLVEGIVRSDAFRTRVDSPKARGR